MESQASAKRWIHAGVDKDSGLIHSVVVTAANGHDLTAAAELLHGDERVVYRCWFPGNRQESGDSSQDKGVSGGHASRQALSTPSA